MTNATGALRAGTRKLVGLPTASGGETTPGRSGLKVAALDLALADQLRYIEAATFAQRPCVVSTFGSRQARETRKSHEITRKCNMVRSRQTTGGVSRDCLRLHENTTWFEAVRQQAGGCWIDEYATWFGGERQQAGITARLLAATNRDVFSCDFVSARMRRFRVPTERRDPKGCFAAGCSGEVRNHVSQMKIKSNPIANFRPRASCRETSGGCRSAFRWAFVFHAEGGKGDGK